MPIFKTHHLIVNQQGSFGIKRFYILLIKNALQLFVHRLSFQAFQMYIIGMKRSLY